MLTRNKEEILEKSPFFLNLIFIYMCVYMSDYKSKITLHMERIYYFNNFCNFCCKTFACKYFAYV